MEVDPAAQSLWDEDMKRFEDQKLALAKRLSIVVREKFPQGFVLLSLRRCDVRYATVAMADWCMRLKDRERTIFNI